MRPPRAWLYRLTGLIRRDARERELRDELESHFQLHIDDNIRAGMTPEEARRQAVLKFGPLEAIKDEVRDRASVPILEILIQDVRYALRRMRRQPGFTALIALTLALGVGANAAMFGLVDVLMFRTPAHVPEPERIVRVSNADSFVLYQELRERLRSVELAAYRRNALSIGSGTDAASLRAECVTPTYFPMLGAAPLQGRAFTDTDDQLGAPRTMMISDEFWRRRFAADPSTIGRPVLVGDQQFEIVGVAPRGFTGVELGAVDAWILLTSAPEACSPFGRNQLRSESGWLTIVGRLRDDMARGQAQRELETVNAGRPPRFDAGGREITRPLTLVPPYASRRSNLTADSRLALWLAGGAGVLLLLACINVAGLLWTHTLERSRELAVRLQLGASRHRVSGQLLVEHLLMASVAATAAVAVTSWLGAVIQRFFPLAEGARLVTGSTLAAIAGLALAAGVLSGVLPILQASRAGTERHLRDGRSVSAARSRVGSALLSLQLGLALALVVAASLFVASVENFRRDFSYDLDRVITASIDFRRFTTRTPDEIQGIYEALLARVSQLPQVETAALSAAPVLSSGGSLRVFGVRRSLSEERPEMATAIEVSPSYFDTLGLDLSGGRGFSAAADPNAAIVLDEVIAARLFPGETPLGQCVFLSTRCLEVVGVSKSYRASLHPTSQQFQVFLPFPPSGNPETTPQVLLVRTRGTAAKHVPAVAAALQGAAPDLPFVNVRTLEQLSDVQARSWLLGAAVFSLFGTLAVLLAGIGIFGALAFSIRQRTVEIGVRMALGAVPRDISWMVLQYGALIAVLGTLLGLVGAFVAGRYMQVLLFNVAAANPLKLTVASMVVVLAALLGCVVPAIRAARVDPAVALRYE